MNCQPGATWAGVAIWGREAHSEGMIGSTGHRPEITYLWISGLFAASCLVALCAERASAAVWFVDIGSAVGDGDGTSWGQAILDLPSAVDAAEAANDPTPEFWIASGLYIVPAGTYVDLTDRPFTQVTFRGGFVGNETSLAQRPAPNTLPPDTFDSGTRFLANFSNVTQFVRTNVPVVIERINVSAFRTAGAGCIVNATNADVEVREVLCVGIEGSQLGGAIATSGSPTVLIEDCRFKSSFVAGGAGGIGGAIFAGGSTELTIRRSVFEDCEAHSGSLAQGDGGAIGLGGGIPNALNLEDCTFQRCHADGQGGAISLFSTTTATIQGCHFIANECFQAAAIAVNGAGAETAPLITIADSEFVQHRGSRTLSLRRSNLLLTGSAFTGNTSNSSFAAVVDLLDSNVTIEDTNFTANLNTAATGKGGAVYTHSEGFGTVTAGMFRRCTFTNNRADYSGGAILAEDLNIAVEDSVFEGNSAGQMGGAVFVMADISPGGDEVPPFAVTGSTFHGNSAVTAGGAIASERELIIDRSSFRRNTGNYGAAVYQLDDGGFIFKNCVFAENAAAIDGGAVAVSFLAFTSSIGFCTFYENRATSDSSTTLAVTTGPAALTIADSIFAESVTPVGTFASAINITVENNLVTPDTVLDVEGQIEGAVTFLDPARGDFRLVASTNAEGQAIGAPTADIRGATRPQGTGPDIGAYEYTPSEDRDGDRVPDILEGNGDTDGDTIPDYLDGDNHNFAVQDINADGAINAVDIQLVINAVLGI